MNLVSRVSKVLFKQSNKYIHSMILAGHFAPVEFSVASLRLLPCILLVRVHKNNDSDLFILHSYRDFWSIYETRVRSI